MKRALCVLALAGLMAGAFAMSSRAADEKPVAAAKDTAKPASLDFTMKDIDGKDVNLEKYAGNVVLVVNVASHCGYTKQYTALEAMYKKYKDQGFVILGFPANNFNHQEPGTDVEIKEFCTSKFAVTFPMLSKISVKGEDMSPLYKYLTSLDVKPKGKGDISWNFEKFVIARDGSVIGRYKSAVTPDDPTLVSQVETALKK